MGSRVPPGLRGCAYARFGAVSNGADAIGYLLGGVMLSLVAVRPTIALIGLGGLAVTRVFAAPTLRAIARERAAAGTATPAPVPLPQVESAGVS